MQVVACFIYRSTVLDVADQLCLAKRFSLTASAVSRELGRQEKESMQKILAITKEGFLLKQQLIQEAKRGIEEKKVRLGRRFQILTCGHSFN